MTGDPADRAGAILEINLAGVAANWRLLAQRVAPAGCAAVVKADGYGLGAGGGWPAPGDAGWRAFFTPPPDEALPPRSVPPPSCEIAVFNGLHPGCGKEFIEYRLIPVLNDPSQVAAWQKIAAGRAGLPAILHLDTGMARLGLTMREFDQVADRLIERSEIAWRA